MGGGGGMEGGGKMRLYTLWGGGGDEIIYLSLHCQHQNDSCIKVGSDESTFEVKEELKQICPDVPLLTPYR